MTTPATDTLTGLFIARDPSGSAESTPVPLKGVAVAARLTGVCAEVTVTQRYRNDEAQPIEAVYVFPLEAGAAVCRFSARLDGRLVEGRVEEREAAFAAYDDAMADGHAALLLDQERPDIFTASVGNLLPGEEIEVTLTYVAEASREGEATRLTIPTTVSPRYVPATGPEVGQPEGERVNPPHWTTVPYGLSLQVEVDPDVPLRAIESPSHTVRTEWRDEGALVQLSSDRVQLDRDFVLLLEPRAAAEAIARVAAEEADGTRVAMVTFRPAPAEVEGGQDVVFVLDCSGSMSGSSIEQARRALALCVRALRAGDRFDILRFGSRYDRLFGKLRAYDDRSLSKATRWIKEVQADLGGTEILTPLEHLLQGRGATEERHLQLLLLTDGQVSNEDALISFCGRHVATTRIFSFGIGAGCSQHLVRGVARATQGASELIFPGERIEPKVLRTFRRVRTPAYDDVTLDWGGLDVLQAPSQVPPVFAGDMVTIFGRVRAGAATEVTLSAAGQRWTVPLDLERADKGGPVPTLWARTRIADLDSGAPVTGGSAQRRGSREDRRRDELVALGRRYGLLSSATSFVAVLERAAGDRSVAPVRLREVPVALTHGWGAGAQAVTASFAAPPPACPSPTPMRAMEAAAFAPQAKSMSKRSRRAPGAGLVDKLKSALQPARRTLAMDAYEPEAEAADGVELFDLLMEQRADGRFELTPIVARWLADRADRVRAASPATPEAVAVTASVLHLLATEHAGEESTWGPAADKARSWLAGRPETASFDAEELLV